eukprot:4380700-Alexandrium_andersonii.AAC.1
MWLDDLVTVINTMGPLVAQEADGSVLMVQKLLASLALEFCWAGKLALNGREVKDWSMARNLLKEL